MALSSAPGIGARRVSHGWLDAVQLLHFADECEGSAWSCGNCLLSAGSQVCRYREHSTSVSLLEELVRSFQRSSGRPL